MGGTAAARRDRDAGRPGRIDNRGSRFLGFERTERKDQALSTIFKGAADILRDFHLALDAAAGDQSGIEACEDIAQRENNH